MANSQSDRRREILGCLAPRSKYCVACGQNRRGRLWRRLTCPVTRGGPEGVRITGLPSSRSKYKATMDSHWLSGPSRNSRQRSRTRLPHYPRPNERQAPPRMAEVNSSRWVGSWVRRTSMDPLANSNEAERPTPDSDGTGWHQPSLAAVEDQRVVPWPSCPSSTRPLAGSTRT